MATHTIVCTMRLCGSVSLAVEKLAIHPVTNETLSHKHLVQNVAHVVVFLDFHGNVHNILHSVLMCQFLVGS